MPNKRVTSLLTQLVKLSHRMEALTEELRSIGNYLEDELVDDYVDKPKTNLNRPKKKARETVYDDPNSR